MNQSQIHLLNIIKIGSILQKNKVELSYKKNYFSFLNLLYKHGIIQNFFKIKISFLTPYYKILIYFRYFFNKNNIRNLKILSKPSLYLHLNYSDICSLYDKKHILFFSTNKGILTSLQCKMLKIGGFVLFKC